MHGANFAHSGARGRSSIDGDLTDGHGHGTHCGGTIAAKMNDNTGISGVASIAGNVKIMGARMMDDRGRGAASWAIEALNYAVVMGARVSSHSYGMAKRFGSLQFITKDLARLWHNAIKAAGAPENDHMFVVAAGNDNYDMDLNPSASFPCSFSLNEPDSTKSPSNVLCVAATTHTCCSSGPSLVYFSNFGKNTVDIAAPGTEILSSVPEQSQMTRF